jgi:hypothetical protein
MARLGKGILGLGELTLTMPHEPAHSDLLVT